MQYGILGSGMVGQALASKLVQGGHSVMIGTRDASKLADWAQGAGVQVGSFEQTAQFGQVLINALSGFAVLDTFQSLSSDAVQDKIVIDIANPLDFSQGMPPTLFVSNTDSLGEQLQRAVPSLRVVKTLNSVTADLMVNPRQLADGEHDLFMCGNDADAKAQVTRLLREEFGWKHITDLGDISHARATEMLLPIWIRLYGKLGTAHFSLRVVQ